MRKLLSILCFLSAGYPCASFVQTRITRTVHAQMGSVQRSRATKTTTTAIFGWEDFVYNAESAASSLATVSLQDPSSLLTSLPILYLAGLLTSVSPCVWGLLPLTMSYISTAAGEREDKEALIPTLAFAAGLASVFCSLGLVAASIGQVLGGSGTIQPLVALGSSLVCIAMGLQLLEFVQLPLLSFSIDNNVVSEGDSASVIEFDKDGLY